MFSHVDVVLMACPMTVQDLDGHRHSGVVVRVQQAIGGVVPKPLVSFVPSLLLPSD